MIHENIGFFFLLTLTRNAWECSLDIDFTVIRFEIRLIQKKRKNYFNCYFRKKHFRKNKTNFFHYFEALFLVYFHYISYQLFLFRLKRKKMRKKNLLIFKFFVFFSIFGSKAEAIRFKSGRSSSTNMERVASDDLQTIRQRHRSPPRSPFLSALWRRQSKTDNSQGKFKEQRRIIVFGAAKVGKSTIVKQFLFDQFTKKYIKTVEDLYVADYNLSSGESLRLEILDSTGSYQFPAMRSLSISNGHAFLLVYSVDNEDSWKEIENLRRQVS